MDKKIWPIHPKYSFLFKKKIDKYLKVGFIEPIYYSPWFSNIVPTLKPNGYIICCTYFRDLNNAFPEDNFSLPHIGIIIESTRVYNFLSFIDGFWGYNHIRFNK